MKLTSTQIQLWSFILRVFAYACGFAGVVIMVSEKTRVKWAYLSIVLLGLMFAGFIGLYFLTIMRIFRK